jgi:hypothetical protein
MAITAAQLQFRTDTDKILTNGQLNNLFGNILTTASGADYKALVVWNNHPTLTLSAVKVWVTPDARGVTFQIATDGAAAATPQGDDWPPIDNVTGLTYSTPTSYETGLTLPILPALTKYRLVARRLMSSVTAASPENNRVWVGGTSPL